MRTSITASARDLTRQEVARSAGPPPSPRARLAAILVVTGVVGVLAGRFALAGSGGEAAAPAPAGSGTVATIARLQAELRSRPDQPRLLTQLGVAQLARARESADPTNYTLAARALERADALAPGDPVTLTGLGLLDLARHDFRGALALGRRAHDANPDSADALGVVTDAQVELGRYDEAAASVQAMVDRRPDLASLSRVSYVRELRGDHAGALAAMGQAASAGTASAPDRALVRTLLGDLHAAAGELGAARDAYRRALDDVDGYGQAEVGLAKVEAAAGDLATAAARLRPVADRLPFPATLALLGDLEAALGHPAEAARRWQLVRAIEGLNRANGVEVDLELARFEADHARDPGADPANAVRLARAALRARPTVYARDTLGWALRQAGHAAEALPHARAAVRLGTRDAVLWYHLAATEADAGRLADARRHLTTALRINPYLTVRDGPAAQALAKRLGLPARGASR